MTKLQAIAILLTLFARRHDAKFIRGAGDELTDGDGFAASEGGHLDIDAADDGDDRRQRIREHIAHRHLSNDGGFQLARPQPRIIGGSTAAPDRFRYSVSIQDRIGHFCGGSLISSDVVLSAAHCAGGDYDVVIDRPNLNTNSGQSVGTRREIQHPRYNSETTNNDFMLVFLDKPVDMSGGVRLVELNSDRNFPSVGQRVTVMGYGDTNPSDYVSDLSSRLMEVQVKVISNQDCDDSSGNIGGFYESYNGQISSSMLCAKETNKDACQGDSGGPLVVEGPGNKDVQVGVVSWGIGCASRDFPGVYARVSSEYDWIREEVCANSRDPAASFECDSNGNGNGNGNGGGSGGNNGGGSGRPPSNKPSEEEDGGGFFGGGPIGGSGAWESIFSENFRSNMGRFSDEVGAKHIAYSKNKSGVVRIQRTARMDTGWYDVESFDRCRATVSFYLIGMERNDDWCVEYRTDRDGYRQARCFDSSDFNNKRWYEDEEASFDVDGANEVTLRLRCRGDSRKDDVLIDDVELECR